MVWITPAPQANFNVTRSSADRDFNIRDKVCLLMLAGNNLYRGFRKPIFWGLDDRGYFVGYFPANPDFPKGGPVVGVESVDTPGWVRGTLMLKGMVEPVPQDEVVTEWRLDWCTNYSTEQAYWNLDEKVNSWNKISVKEGFDYG